MRIIPGLQVKTRRITLPRESYKKYICCNNSGNIAIHEWDTDLPIPGNPAKSKICSPHNLVIQVTG